VANDWIREIVADAGTIEQSCHARAGLHKGSEMVPATPARGHSASTISTTTLVNPKPITMSRAPATVEAELLERRI
jgi:hypothetical protein